MKRLICCLLILCITLPFPLAFAKNNDAIVLELTGSLSEALNSVSDGGTIRIDTRYNIPEDFVWENHGKTVTITGGILSFTKHQNFFLGDNIRFEGIQLQFADNSYLFVNGFDLYVHEDVTVRGKVIVYGGGKQCDVPQVNLTLMGGTFFNVYGGCNGGDVLGDVNVMIGGNFNKDLEISHTHEYQVFGGGYNCRIQGNVNLTFGGKARANYIYGGSSNYRSRISGHIKLDFNGGKAMSICGGSKDVDQRCDVYLFFSGGEVQQIFGGCEKSGMTGNILVQITGGKITRRIYGGCYNNYDSGGWQDIPNFVNGNILLYFDGKANITQTYSGGDLSVYAHSRHEYPPTTESAHIAYADNVSRIRYKDLLGAKDGTMSFIMGSAKTSDGEHILTYSVSENTITQSCNKHDSATASVSVWSGIFTGEPLENVTVNISENWLGPAPLVEYSHNTSVGIAQAKITMGDATLTVQYVIWPPVWVMITAGVALLLITGGITAFFIIRKIKRKKAAT